jgi:hypothetical protein
MDTVFQAVYQALLWLSAATGFSYKEVNVIVYFILIPLVFIVLIDRIMKTWTLTICTLAAMTAFLLWIPDFSSFANLVFDASVAFLNGFSVLGLNYTDASVVICVVFPAIFFLLLILLAFAGRRRPHKMSEG